MQNQRAEPVHVGQNIRGGGGVMRVSASGGGGGGGGVRSVAATGGGGGVWSVAASAAPTELTQVDKQLCWLEVHKHR